MRNNLVGRGVVLLYLEHLKSLSKSQARVWPIPLARPAAGGEQLEAMCLKHTRPVGFEVFSSLKHPGIEVT